MPRAKPKPPAIDEPEHSPPALAVVYLPVAQIAAYETNPRTHSVEQIGQIANSITEFGWTNPCLIDANNELIAGHGRLAAGLTLGMTQIPCIRLGHLTPTQKRALVIADNKLSLNAGWDNELLKLELSDLGESGFNLDLIGFNIDELTALLSAQSVGLTDPDDAPSVPVHPVSRLGDVWCAGRHKISVGSSSDDIGVQFFGSPDLCLTDPPYCSGGFQEAGRSAGSVGTSGKHKQIANDRLSSRGFSSLMKASTFAIPAKFFYIFTDWRMWVYLFDAAETSSAGVRSMITWNKGTPGMGLGWRSQHELIMWATRISPPYAKGFPGLGNVISLARQKNTLHTTQKPVELLQTLLQGAPFARTVADPFVGSGSTVIACEIEGRDCLATDLDPAYVDTAVIRWQNFTGKAATLEGDGRTFEQIAADRLVEVADG